MTSRVTRSTPELSALVGLFYDEPAALGAFTEVTGAELPATPFMLLAHDAHMTVTVETFHGGPVSLEVLQTRISPTHYARKIILHRHSDRRVVLFGLVRMAVALLDPEVRQEIESQQIPLGRVLIQHNVMRNVRLLSLWRIDPGPDLCQALRLDHPEICYGRTALIYCDNVPAVELLEIVPPER